MTARKKLTLLALGGPIFVEQGLHALVGTVDTLMVSRVSDYAVAALGPSNQIVILAIIIFNFVGIGSSIVITHHLGAGDPRGASRIAATAIAVNTWLGLLLSALLFAFALPVIELLRLPEELIPLAMQYLPLMGGTLFLEAQNIARGAVLRAHGYPRDPMWVTAVQNVVNVIGNFLLLFGLLGFPKLGIMGVAIATVISRVVALAALWWLVRARTGVRIGVRAYLVWPVREVRRILRIGLPAAGENVCWWLALMAVTSLVARMGPTELATQSYVMQVGAWVVLFGSSIGLGTEILIGNYIGAGDFESAYRETLRSLKIGLVIVASVIALIALLAPSLLGLFSENPMIIATGALLLRMGLILEPGRVFNLVVINALRATGDSRFPFYVGVASMWGVWVSLSYVLGLKLGLGLVGVWIAMVTDEWLRALIMYRRWRRRTWMQHALASRAEAMAGAAETSA